MKINILLSCLILFTGAVNASEDDHNHSGHSDDLLTLLQYKIAIVKLQKKFPVQGKAEKSNNIKRQHDNLNKALPILKNYIAIPESRYPNLDMYQQSLQSRAALLNEYAELLETLNTLSQ